MPCLRPAQRARRARHSVHVERVVEIEVCHARLEEPIAEFGKDPLLE
jgi:hypothetical protein